MSHIVRPSVRRVLAVWDLPKCYSSGESHGHNGTGTADSSLCSSSAEEQTNKRKTARGRKQDRGSAIRGGLRVPEDWP